MKGALAIVLALSARAFADHLVVSSDARVRAAVPSATAVAAGCDRACAAREGAAVAVAQVVTIARGPAGLELELVDAADGSLIGRRTVALSDAQLAAQLPGAIARFLAEGPTVRAKELFAKGNEHYALAEYAPALAQYKLAYRVKPLPAFLFNIAQCHRKLNQHADAIAMYQSYLVGVPDAPNKALVDELVAESRAALAAEQAEAERRASDQARADAELRAAEQRRAEELRKAREAEAVIAARRAEQAKLEAELYDRHPARTYALVGGAVGAAALITGGAFGIAARGRQAAFDAAGCGDPARLLVPDELATCVADRDRGERHALLSNAFLIGGGALAIASALVFVFDPGNVARPQATIAITPSSASLQVRW